MTKNIYVYVTKLCLTLLLVTTISVTTGFIIGRNYMKISDKGIELIKNFEGCRYTTYKDVGGVLTVGYGHTGKDVHEGVTITPAAAEALLRADIEAFEEGVTRSVTVDLTQAQFDALVSLSFNIGLGAFTLSTLRLMLNDGNFKGAADQFLRWNKVQGKVWSALTERRQTERQLFLAEEH